MNDTNPHPARSTEFLSRLYDGELLPEESDAFAAHRAACEECRGAAEAFAATLAAFRSSPTAPPAADLSARILRKIRAQSPSRRPFGVSFGIDIRWAGVFVAALLVVLISAPLVLRRGEVAPAARPAIPARIFEEAPRPPQTAAPAPQQKSAPGRPAPAAPPPAPAPLAKDERPAQNAAAPPPRAPVAGEAPVDEEKRRFAMSPRLSDSTASRRASPEASGGDAGAFAAPEFAEAAPRVVVQALDGQGVVPAIVSRPAADRLAALRGHEFILLVETGGRVRSVLAPAQTPAPSRSAGDPLRELLFAPGDRPRRLLVRVE